MTGLVIIGAGGFGREVFALVTAISPKGQPWVIDGFVDDHPFADDTARVHALGSHVLGTVEVLAAFRAVCGRHRGRFSGSWRHAAGYN
ncbi:MAG: hypothetical protein WCG47_32035, partial [Dermatophilaceae bacterium]